MNAKELRERSTEDLAELRASLAKDLFAGRETEDEQILGDLVDRAHAANLEVPLFEAARAAARVAATRR
jgi:2-dehydropantoate 2-reductase